MVVQTLTYGPAIQVRRRSGAATAKVTSLAMLAVSRILPLRNF